MKADAYWVECDGRLQAWMLVDGKTENLNARVICRIPSPEELSAAQLDVARVEWLGNYRYGKWGIDYRDGMWWQAVFVNGGTRYAGKNMREALDAAIAS